MPASDYCPCLMALLVIMSLVMSQTYAEATTQQRRRYLKKTDAFSPSPISPTKSPSFVLPAKPDKLPHTEVPPVGYQMPPECDKKNADKLDICIEWLDVMNASVAPTPSPSPSGEMYTIEFLPTEIANIMGLPEETPTDSIVGETEEVEQDKEVGSTEESTATTTDPLDVSNTVLIQLGDYDMHITIYSQTNRKLSASEEATKEDVDHSMARQPELETVRLHLNDVYREAFLNPVVKLDLSFVSEGETDLSESTIRHSTFFGSVSFARVVEYPIPSSMEVESVTTAAFVGEQKESFLNNFHQFYGRPFSKEDVSYDVIVQRSGYETASVVNGRDQSSSEGSSGTWFIIGAVAGGCVIVIASFGLVYYLQLKRDTRKKHDNSPPSPMRSILHHKKTYCEFTDEDGLVFDLDVVRPQNITDAYNDSNSITSTSQCGRFPQLKFDHSLQIAIEDGKVIVAVNSEDGMHWNGDLESETNKETSSDSSSAGKSNFIDKTYEEDHVENTKLWEGSDV
jgi:hypothetical protein